MTRPEQSVVDKAEIRDQSIGDGQSSRGFIKMMASKVRTYCFSQLVLLAHHTHGWGLFQSTNLHGNEPASFVARRPMSSTGGSERRSKPVDSDMSKRFRDASQPPYLAVITEPDACDSVDRIETTLKAVESAVSTNKVALVVVRVVQPSNTSLEEFEARVVDFARDLMALTVLYRFRVVVTSDFIKVAAMAPAHGVHVKEKHRDLIPSICQQFESNCIIGTSSHSIVSVLDAWSKYQPDYIFVGTCFKTASHPDKLELEGPALPGDSCRALNKVCQPHPRPIVLAIGGINEHNCKEPVVTHGADGVAVIRAVLKSPDPAETVHRMYRNMQGAD